MSRLALSLGEVQLTVLRAARIPMIRPAQAYLLILQRRLDALFAGQTPVRRPADQPFRPRSVSGRANRDCMRPHIV